MKILLIGLAMINFDALWDFTKPQETEVKFRELLPMAESSGNEDYLLQLYTQVARAEGLQRKFLEGHFTLDSVANRLNRNTKTAEIRYNLERGRLFNSAKEKIKALPYFETAFSLALEAKEDSLAVDSAHMIAIAEPSPEKQLAWNERAVQIAENSPHAAAKAWLASLYNNIGWTLHDSGRFSEALAIFEKALLLREKKGESTSIRIAKWCIARTYRSLGRIEDAVTWQKSLEQELDKNSEKDGYVFEELGELYLLQKNIPESKKYFLLAYDELSKDQWLVANEANRLARIKELAK